MAPRISTLFPRSNRAAEADAALMDGADNFRPGDGCYVAAEADAQSQSTSTGSEGKKAEPIRNVGAKVGRNDPCPCGSGKKYKNCHMKLEARK